MTHGSILKTFPALVLTLCLAFPAALAQEQIPEKPLTNSQVVEMVKANLSADEIIAKIKISRCHFDTNPSVLAELRYRGVPDAVLTAMADAPYGAAPKRPDVTSPSTETKNDAQSEEHKVDAPATKTFMQPRRPRRHQKTFQHFPSRIYLSLVTWLKK